MTPPIHQRHREAAADYWASIGEPFGARIREGFEDDDSLVLAFARFEQQLLAGRRGVMTVYDDLMLRLECLKEARIAGTSEPFRLAVQIYRSLKQDVVWTAPNPGDPS